MILDLIIKVLLVFCLISSTIMLLPGSILLDIHPRVYRHLLPRSLDQYRSLDHVNIDQFVQIDLDYFPESIAIHDGKFVTGSKNGTIYLINNDDSVKPLVKIIDKQTDNSRVPLSLGLQFDSKGVLYAVQPYYGIYKVENIFTSKPKVSLVLDIEQTAQLGMTSKFLNDLAIQEKQNGEHILFITDFSSKFSLKEWRMSLLSSDYTGRVLRYDINNKKLDTIAQNIFMPNGIEIAKDNSAVLFSEFGTRTVWKYSLKGENKTKLEKILTNLPAEVDNIRVSQTGQTYWLAMFKPRSLFQQSDLDYFMKKPLLRKLILRSLHLIGTLLDYTTRLIPNEYFSNVADDLKSVNGVHLLSGLLGDDDQGGMIMEIDLDGNILNTIYTEDRTELSKISEVREIPSNNPQQRILYLGSYSHPYVRKMIIST